ncbi:MAG: hypothetical protein IJ105_00990 [Bacilli bacterium]|nr:hypothetical protein [Bacilli bacterium]
MFDKFKKIMLDEKSQKIVFIVAVVIIVILSLLLIISRNFGTFNNISMRKNNKDIFSVSDLTVNNLKFSDKESKVKKELGNPTKEKEETENNYKYKKLYYDGITLTLKENYDDFMLVKVEITSKKYKINRNIKVNDKILRVMKKFKIENTTGTYLYGNYTIEQLNNSELKDNVYVAVRSNSEVVYINKDAQVSDGISNIARLNISYKHGKVSKITWSYDYK